MNDILFGNTNRPVIKKLAGRYFKSSKSRNVIAVIAIILTSILFTTIFTLGSGLLDTIQDQNIRKAGGDGHAALSYISDDIFDEIKDNELIDRMVCKVMITGILSKINRYKSVMSCVSIIQRQMDSIVQWMLRLI